MDKLLKLKTPFNDKKSTRTLNFVFGLNYKFTFYVLVAFTVLINTNQFFGKPIECTTGQKNVPKELLNTYCWIHPTFIVKDQSTSVKDIPYPGVKNSKQSTSNNQLPDLQYNGFYQWVALTLSIQAMFMYLPRLIWKKYENEIAHNLLLDTDVGVFEDDKRELKAKYIIKHLLKHPKISRNSRYYLLLFVELLNLVNTVVQFIMMNYFLNMNFKEYGWKVLEYQNWSYSTFTDPMTRAFPKMAKCKYYDYGSSGSPQSIDHLCILPYNVFNEKIYLFLWVWFQLLIICNLLNLFLRLLLSFSRDLRATLITKDIDVDKKVLSKVINRSTIGEWYILKVLSLNLDTNLFEQVISGIYNTLTDKCNSDNV